MIKKMKSIIDNKEGKNEMKKNIFIVLVIIVFGLLIGTASFNYLKNKRMEILNNSIKSVNEYPKENDSNVKTYYLEELVKNSKINLSTNFEKTLFTTNDGLKYYLTCDNFLEKNSNCEHIKIEINGFDTQIDFDNSSDSCENKSYILMTDKNLINQESNGCGIGGPITIYDKQGYKILKEDYSEYMYNNVGQAVIKNNILYYLTYANLDSDKIYFASFNLKTKTKNIIETIDEKPIGLKNQTH